LRDNETNPIPRAMMSLQGHADFALFGDDYGTPEGTAIGGYIQVDLRWRNSRTLQLLEV
jgi:UDP-glucose 4-epimerase